MEILYLKCEQPLSEFDMGRKVLTNENSIIIGIAGGSASGKTSISRQVYEFLKEVIQHVLLNKMIIIKIKVIFLLKKELKQTTIILLLLIMIYL